MKEQMEEMQKQIDQLVEFIQNELSKIQKDENPNTIVKVQKAKVICLSDIINKKREKSKEGSL